MVNRPNSRCTCPRGGTVGFHVVARQCVGLSAASSPNSLDPLSELVHVQLENLADLHQAALDALSWKTAMSVCRSCRPRVPLNHVVSSSLTAGGPSFVLVHQDVLVDGPSGSQASRYRQRLSRPLVKSMSQSSSSSRRSNQRVRIAPATKPQRSSP